MTEFKLKDYNETRVIYYYYPEGDKYPGEVEYTFTTKTANALTRAANDETGYYSRKAILKLEEKFATCIDENRLPFRFTQAWC